MADLSKAFGAKTLKAVEGLIGKLANFKVGNMKGQWFPGSLAVPVGMMSAGHARTLHAAGQGDKPIYVVFSYGTPIAWRTAGDQGACGWTIPAVRYSVTTSKHQGIARRGAARWDERCEAVAMESENLR
jgi:hypothetical protein